jgi:hypothetical protein
METSVETSTTLQWQKHRNLTACLCLGRQRSVWSAGGCGERGEVSKRGVETAVRIQGWAHRKTMKRHRLDPLSLIQGKRREHRSGNGHQRCTLPPSGEQGGPAVETAVMIRGRTHRKTMKQPCLILCLSSKENEDNAVQAMAINAARPSSGGQGKPAMKETSVETAATRQC